MEYFSTEQRLRLARSLFTKSSPSYVQFYVTARCNLACEQCNIIYGMADSPEMTLSQIRQVAENLARIGVCIVLFIGGEPFMRQDLPEIVEAFTSMKIHVRLQTNGLASKRALARCVEAGAHDISISLDTLEPELQDTINGSYRNSWNRALETVAAVSEVFPETGSGFFGTVLMPRNVNHILDVVEFATEIGWWVSLVPVHTAVPLSPRGFRSFDETGVCRFSESDLHAIGPLMNALKKLRNTGYNVYDSDEYLDDILRFVEGKPTRWRRRNGGVCDSPNLYFAIEPNGNLRPCCDYRLKKQYPVYDPSFPQWFFSGEIHEHVYEYTSQCRGCMYGSYPEISITARYLAPLVQRFLFFNYRTSPRLKKLSTGELREVAQKIHMRKRQIHIQGTEHDQ